MFRVYWKERMPDGTSRMYSKIFAGRDERMLFILSLEKRPMFIRVVRCEG